ncbi:hypothetical protein HELRODRAFT_178151 [Helobdella robusta]|uniref:Ig-like domain-containing protein n=1 Tax=Helobdella robusta TaxID=6412 RepID=T1FCU5_HELRO|nr:hypothetical protein HELRODRAFT_178151 [Helobdella robusta]ESN97363.1 hypothetical protein HELRODRAFT_178151 [Helobdella robusta]
MKRFFKIGIIVILVNIKGIVQQAGPCFECNRIICTFQNCTFASINSTIPRLKRRPTLTEIRFQNVTAGSLQPSFFDRLKVGKVTFKNSTIKNELSKQMFVNVIKMDQFDVSQTPSLLKSLWSDIDFVTPLIDILKIITISEAPSHQFLTSTLKLKFLEKLRLAHMNFPDIQAIFEFTNLHKTVTFLEFENITNLEFNEQIFKKFIRMETLIEKICPNVVIKRDFSNIMNDLNPNVQMSKKENQQYIDNMRSSEQNFDRNHGEAETDPFKIPNDYGNDIYNEVLTTSVYDKLIGKTPVLPMCSDGYAHISNDDNVLIKCFVSGDPPVEVTVKLPNGNKLYFNRSHRSLRYTAEHRSYNHNHELEGVYECYAANMYGVSDVLVFNSQRRNFERFRISDSDIPNSKFPVVRGQRWNKLYPGCFIQYEEKHHDEIIKYKTKIYASNYNPNNKMKNN